MYLKGQKLTITEHKNSQSLQRFKQTFNSRRIFVRVLARSQIAVDLWDLFSRFGEVEQAYFIPESELIQPNNYTIIGYVLFRDVSVVNSLVQLGSIQLDASSKLLIKTIETQGEGPKTKKKLAVITEERDEDREFADEGELNNHPQVELRSREKINLSSLYLPHKISAHPFTDKNKPGRNLEVHEQM